MIQKSPKVVFDFLSVVDNHQHLMPSQVTGWKSEGDTCEYTIVGTGSINLKVKERVLNERVSMEPNGRIPFPFEVHWQIIPENDGSMVQLYIDADLNPFLKMLASTPLKSFINLQIDHLKVVLDGN